MPRKKSTKTQAPQVATAVQTPVSSSCCDCDCAKPAVESAKPSTAPKARIQKQQNFIFYFHLIFSPNRKHYLLPYYSYIMQIETITKKWGNSIVIIIPTHIVKHEGIKENQRVKVNLEIKRLPLVKDLFGLLKGKIKRPTQEIKDEMRAGWLSETDRKKEEEWKKK